MTHTAVPVIRSRPRLMPAGIRVVLDPATRTMRDGVLLGGSPLRVMRLSDTGREAMREITDGPLVSPRARRLARRLTDAGLAHPRPAKVSAPSITVVVPVHDRADDLDRCLTALGDRHPVLVVDDGSRDPAWVLAVANRHGVTVVRRETNGGPAAARNTALALIDTDLVALLDSDCTPSPDWIERLAGHLADSEVAIAAPRVVPALTNTSARRYAAACGSLDLGSREARVVPRSPVAYVPTAALVARRHALLEIACDGAVFDESMRYGEDVDVIWRLHARGWRIRFDPSVTVRHREPATWPELLVRRYRYGTSAAPLSRRHPGLVTPAVVRPLPLLAVAALATRHRAVAVAAFAVGVERARRTLAAAGLDQPSSVVTNTRVVGATWVGISRYLTQVAAPLVAIAAVVPGSRSRRRVASALLLTPVLDGWRSRRGSMNPGSFAIGTVADHVAYGAGVWAGAIHDRTATPLLPTIV
jgi:mycofactocin system glycosyltransferase